MKTGSKRIECTTNGGPGSGPQPGGGRAAEKASNYLTHVAASSFHVQQEKKERSAENHDAAALHSTARTAHDEAAERHIPGRGSRRESSVSLSMTAQHASKKANSASGV